MKKATLIGLLLFCTVCFHDCSRKKTEDQFNRTAFQDNIESGQSKGLSSQKEIEEAISGVIEGVIQSVEFSSDDWGNIGFTDVEGNKYNWVFQRPAKGVDLSLSGKTAIIYWSLHVDTDLDEANTYNKVDSISLK